LLSVKSYVDDKNGRALSETHDLGPGKFFQSVAGVEDQRREVGDQSIIEYRMIGENRDAIYSLDQLRSQSNRFEQMPIDADRRHIGIGKRNRRAFVAQRLENRDGGRLAHVVGVALVRHADAQNFCALQTLAAVIESVGDAAHGKAGIWLLIMLASSIRRGSHPFILAFQVK
jgi:hypothetical protein